jgi:hypothetical protein
MGISYYIKDIGRGQDGAQYIEQVLQKRWPVPAPLAQQVQHILREVKA